MKEIQREKILGIPIDIVTKKDALEFVITCIQNNKGGSYILAVNSEKIMALQKESFLNKIYEEAALLLPDGIGVVFAMRWIRGKKIKKLAGADLMQIICKEAEIRGYNLFIFGGTEEVNKNAVKKIKMIYPKIKIVGRSNGYLDERGRRDLLNKINDSQVEILFVGLGSPRQEIWIQRYLPQLNIKICQAVGGTLDVISGRKKRAPRVIQKLGLEWLYRLLKEPKRIHRQIVYPIYLAKVIMEKHKKEISQ